jgi:putative ABC transport system substrate-binding protein
MGPVSSLDRRAFVVHLAGLSASVAGLALLSGCGLVLPSAAQSPKVPHVGYIGDPGPTPWATALWEGLRELGWLEGANLIVERRYSQSRLTWVAEEQLALVAELVALPVDVLVTVGTPHTLAARQATETLPIVFINIGDPIGVGVVASLARPGGNVTGVSQGASTALQGKQLELLGAVVPGLTHVARIVDAINPAANAVGLARTQEAASVLGVQVRVLDVASPDDLASAFATAASWPAHGVMVSESGLLLNQRARLAQLAADFHLPAMYQVNEFVDAGGLMSYGTSDTAIHRRAAIHVDKILRGARPADMPIDQITTVDFAVNVKAAQALGLTLPADVAAQVTQWVP